MPVPGLIRRLMVACLLSAAAGRGLAEEWPASCPPCRTFDHLDKQIRDNLLPRTEAQRQFAATLAELDAFLARTGQPASPPDRWVLPLRGYSLAVAGPDAARGYVAAGYDYFDGNRHGGHPSFDLFIRDRDRDSLDDATRRPVEVLSLTGGIVVAAETTWDVRSRLRGGKYLWIYDAANRLLVYYAHNDRLLVQVGDRVAPGTPVATVGRSGLNAWKSRSPTHLHLTVLRLQHAQPVPLNIHPRLLELQSVP